MTALDERPTLDERYAAAIGSSNLEVLPTRCSVDYLIAAGWCRDDLGTRLFRLRTEFDAVRGGHRQAEANARAEFAAVAELLRKSWAQSDEEISALRQAEADLAFKAAAAAATTARALLMVHLQSLHDTAQALHVYSIMRATRLRVMLPDDQVHRIAARALELWIDPNCPSCEGRGFRGGFVSPVVLCTDCDGTGNRGTGRRMFRLAKSEYGHQFGRLLLTDMDGMTERIARQMQRYIRNQEKGE